MKKSDYGMLYSVLRRKLPKTRITETALKEMAEGTIRGAIEKPGTKTGPRTAHSRFRGLVLVSV